MNTCDTCKYWRIAEAVAILSNSTHALCGHPKLASTNATTGGGSDYEDGAEDGEAYSGIYTGPKFGCIHWEAKMNEPTPEGMTRWEPDGKYNGKLCTCKPQCDDPCHGECGCEACHDAYADFLSNE